MTSFRNLIPLPVKIRTWPESTPAKVFAAAWSHQEFIINFHRGNFSHCWSALNITLGLLSVSLANIEVISRTISIKLLRIIVQFDAVLKTKTWYKLYWFQYLTRKIGLSFLTSYCSLHSSRAATQLNFNEFWLIAEWVK